eukprot:CAMPEP_0114334448 /NCGR_PEP_ID=MMETSP0101-20121206/4382_1 /TAXON_ID=38822 ORGANISM="Pteridomonas danica, Strain PT" /NCGR_SAMPLE_ID=MMETSP0101 /ASSEMBLY_ACC=CAM_ASM_000211 /LENGTH=93 /DNA_ID=CAMNT_0001465711 /DNA_START=652 /DNA_END=933 /DNA_ORIENTATION=+
MKIKNKKRKTPSSSSSSSSSSEILTYRPSGGLETIVVSEPGDIQCNDDWEDITETDPDIIQLGNSCQLSLSDEILLSEALVDLGIKDHEEEEA